VTEEPTMHTDDRKPPQDVPPHDYAVIRSAGAIRTWNGAYWAWIGGDWVYRGEVPVRPSVAMANIEDLIEVIEDLTTEQISKIDDISPGLATNLTRMAIDLLGEQVHDGIAYRGHCDQPTR
jgi:hypothetical protein